jgi:hypothetical protein
LISFQFTISILRKQKKLRKASTSSASNSPVKKSQQSAPNFHSSVPPPLATSTSNSNYPPLNSSTQQLPSVKKPAELAPLKIDKKDRKDKKGMDKHKTKISLSAPTAASKDQSDRLAISKKNLSKAKSKSRDERDLGEEDPLSAPTPKAKKVVVQPIKLDLQPVSQEIIEGVTKHPLLLMVLIASAGAPPAPSSVEGDQGQPSGDEAPGLKPVHRTKSTDSALSTSSHPAVSSGNGEIRIVIKVYDTVTSSEALHYINQREYTLFLEEYCTHVASDKARGVFQPGNLAFWSANIRKIIQIQEKSSGDGKLKISISKKALTEVITALLVEKKEQERMSTPSSPTSTLRKGLRPASSSSPSTQNRSSSPPKQQSTSSIRQPTPEKPQSKQQQQRPSSNQKKEAHQTTKPKSASTRLQTDPSSSSSSKRSSSPSSAKATPKSSTPTAAAASNANNASNNPPPAEKRQSMPNVKLNDYSLLPSAEGGNHQQTSNKSQKNLVSSKQPSSTSLPISKAASSDNIITPAAPSLTTKSKSNVSVEKQASQSKIVPDLKKEKSMKDPPSSAPAQMSRSQSNKSRNDQLDDEYDADFETPTVPPTAIPVQRQHSQTQQQQQQQRQPSKQLSTNSLKNPSLDQGSDYPADFDEKEQLKEYLQDKPSHSTGSAGVSSSKELSVGQLSSSIVTEDDTHCDPAFNEFFQNIDFNQVRKSISAAATKSASRDHQDDSGAIPSINPERSLSEKQQKQQQETEILQLDQQSLIEEIDDIDGKYSSIFEEGNNNNANNAAAASGSIYEESFVKEDSIPTTVKSQKSSSIKMNNSNSVIEKYGEDGFESVSGLVQSESLSLSQQLPRKSNNQEESFDEEEIIEENSSIAVQDKIQANEREDDNRRGNVQHSKSKLEDPSYYTEFEDEDLYTIDD